MKLLLIAVLSTCMLTACVGRQAKWSMVGGTQVVENEPIEVEWPQAWMKLTPAEADESAKKEGLILILTRDGIELQAITLKRRALEQGFIYTGKKANSGMLPQELAEIVVDDLRANPNFIDLQVVGNSPTTLDGVPGYKLVVQFRNKAGLPKEAVYYGCLVKGSLYILIYEAPQRHYFPLDLPTFEAVKSSFKWKSQGGTSS